MQIFHQQGLYNLNHFLLSHTRQARCARLSHKWARGGSNCKRQIWNELCSCCYPRWSAQCHQGSPNILVFLMFKPCTACCSIIVWTEIIYVVFQWCYACFSYCYAKNCINKQTFLTINIWRESLALFIFVAQWLISKLGPKYILDKTIDGATPLHMAAGMILLVSMYMK